MKLVHLVGFIIKKFITMQHGHMNVKKVSVVVDGVIVVYLVIERDGFHNGYWQMNLMHPLQATYLDRLPVCPFACLLSATG